MTAPDAPLPEQTHPGLTIGVYRISPDGTRTTVQEPTTVPPARSPMATNSWPLCGCGRCAKRRT